MLLEVFLTNRTRRVYFSDIEEVVHVIKENREKFEYIKKKYMPRLAPAKDYVLASSLAKRNGRVSLDAGRHGLFLSFSKFPANEHGQHTDCSFRVPSMFLSQIHQC